MPSEPVVVSFADENDTVITAEELKTKWPVFLETLIEDRPNLGTFLSSSTIASCDNNVVNIRFGQQHRFQYSDVTKKNNREEIVTRLTNFFSASIELHITLETHQTDGQSTAPLKTQNFAPASINDELEQEPIIQTILDVFDGEIL